MKKITRRFLSLLLSLLLVLSLGVTALAADKGDCPEALCIEANSEEESLCTEIYSEEDTQVPDETEVPSAGEDAQLPEEAESVAVQDIAVPCAHKYEPMARSYVEYTSTATHTYVQEKFKQCVYCRDEIERSVDRKSYPHDITSGRPSCDGRTLTTPIFCSVCGYNQPPKKTTCPFVRDHSQCPYG